MEKQYHQFIEDRKDENDGKLVYMFMSYHQNAGHNHNIKIANKFFKNMEEFQIFGKDRTNQNYI
jgi:hypothetical protein